MKQQQPRRRRRLLTLWVLLTTLALPCLGLVEGGKENEPVCWIPDGHSYQKKPLNNNNDKNNHDNGPSTLSSLAAEVNFAVQIVPTMSTSINKNRDENNPSSSSSSSSSLPPQLGNISATTWSTVLLQPLLPYFFDQCRTREQQTYPASVWEYFPPLERVMLHMEYTTTSTSHDNNDDDNDNDNGQYRWKGRLTGIQTAVVNPAEHALAEQHLHMAMTKALIDVVAWWSPSPPPTTTNPSFENSTAVVFPVQSMTLSFQNNNKDNNTQEVNSTTRDTNHSLWHTFGAIVVVVVVVVLATGGAGVFVALTWVTNQRRLGGVGRRSHTSSLWLYNKPSRQRQQGLSQPYIVEDTEHSETSWDGDDDDDDQEWGQELVVVRVVDTSTKVTQ